MFAGAPKQCAGCARVAAYRHERHNSSEPQQRCRGDRRSAKQPKAAWRRTEVALSKHVFNCRATSSKEETIDDENTWLGVLIA